MELQFSKTDLGRLVRGDWELVCGPWKKGCADKAGRWLHIESDGLYLNNPLNTPKPWVHPGREGLVLPLPTFTLEQFKSFCDWHPTFEWEAIESVFTNDDGTLDEDALKELASRGEAAAALARGVLLPHDDEYMRAWETHCQIDELRAEIAELKSLRPTTITERAIAKQELEKLNTRLNALQQPEPAVVGAAPAQPQTATPAPVVADSASNGPLPLTTGDIAFCFDGIRWNEQQWRKPLGDKPKWLQSCVAIPGQRGVSETRWNPVLMAAALVRDGHAQARSIRARFQTKPQLKDWLEAWKTYEADNFDAQ